MAKRLSLTLLILYGVFGYGVFGSLAGVEFEGSYVRRAAAGSRAGTGGTPGLSLHCAWQRVT
jgi:hypothetical protein